MDDHAIDTELAADVLRASLPATIETADADEGGEGKRRIRGHANTFGVMRSKRIIHPKAIEDWLKAHPNTRPALLAQHGMVGGFATIGQVTKMEVERSRGLYFEATIAAGTELADQAWTLIRQGLLNSLSIGWAPLQARWVRIEDHDLDPWFARKMKDAGVSEAYGFLSVDLVEISLVDVADDPDAKLAAKAGGAAIEAAVAPLRQGLAALRAEVATFKAAGGSGDASQLLSTLREHSAEFIDDLKDAVIEALQADELLASVAAGFREDFEELAELSRETGDPAPAGGDDTELTRLQRRVARGPGR